MLNKKILSVNHSEDSHCKPRQKMPNIHRKKIQLWDNPQNINFIPSKWQKKSLDSQVIKQRKQMIPSSSKVSPQAPDWLKRTFHYYYRNSMPRRIKYSRCQQQKYNVLNQKKTISFSTNFDNQIFNEKEFSQNSSASNYSTFFNTGLPPGYSGMRFNSIQISDSRVSPKVGSLNTRDYTIKKPLLKIGKQLYVDTYSPFKI